MVYDGYIVWFMMGIWYGYDEYMVPFIKDIWYGTLWVSE